MKTKWINVKDQLPDKTGEYLTWDGSIYYCQQFCTSGGGFWEIELNGDFVTHWMPLPEPPTD